MLNQLFNRGVLGARCKTCLNLAISRIKLLKNRRDAQLKQMRKEIALFLQSGQEAIARIRVEHVIREQNTLAAYEIIEMFCEFVLARVPILESQRECPIELREAITSIIFAAPRCSDLPDLLQIKNLFTAKYGKEFISAISELRPDTSVNRTIIEKLSVCAPPGQEKLKTLKEIAREYNVNWDSSKTEAEFSKKHDDLLDGPKQGAVLTAVPVQQSITPRRVADKPKTEVLPSYGSTSNKPLTNSNGSRAPNTDSSLDSTASNRQKEARVSDILEKARAAIASAERASAAARAASELVNVNFGLMNLEGGKS
ncbi:uncharacterized protein LOC141598933 [Silene latifolia]|uniref:uncharacterized protein LOC141598933 n=1 Tax=Silene latifolia TaxID=37657 RepID=UPI003D786EAE